jgi:hypothetical protein
MSALFLRVLIQSRQSIGQLFWVDKHLSFLCLDLLIFQFQILYRLFVQFIFGIDLNPIFNLWLVSSKFVLFHLLLRVEWIMMEHFKILGLYVLVWLDIKPGWILRLLNFVVQFLLLLNIMLYLCVLWSLLNFQYVIILFGNWFKFTF